MNSIENLNLSSILSKDWHLVKTSTDYNSYYISYGFQLEGYNSFMNYEQFIHKVRDAFLHTEIVKQELEQKDEEIQVLQNVKLELEVKILELEKYKIYYDLHYKMTRGDL